MCNEAFQQQACRTYLSDTSPTEVRISLRFNTVAFVHKAVERTGHHLITGFYTYTYQRLY